MPQNKLKRNSNFDFSNQYPGLPGYRTRSNRSGLDPLDTNREAAYMEGTFYRKIFTFKLRTRNFFYLSLMFVFGVIPFIFFIYLLNVGLQDSHKSIGNSILTVICFLILFIAIPGAITANFILSILEIAKIIPPLYPNPPKPKERKKKFPKRRKDFK